MAHSIKLAEWNANGLANHSQELTCFITNNNIDIMMISETHFTSKSYIKIPNYNIYTTNHPTGSAHGGTAIIVKNSIKHHECIPYHRPQLQATSIVIEDWFGKIKISAIYCPPKHTIKNDQFAEFFDTLGPRFIAGGDYNAKHQFWGSRLATTRGRELLKTSQNKHLQFLSTGEPTYWPTDRKKIPDLIDFCVTKGISHNYISCVSSFDLSSDHSPIVITLSTKITTITKPTALSNQNTNWEQSREIISNELNLKLPLHTASEIDNAVEHLVCTIQRGAWLSTPPSTYKITKVPCPEKVKRVIAEKRKLRRIWQNNRNAINKTNLNRAVRNLKRLLDNNKNEGVTTYLKQLTATDETNYSLWKATKRLNQPKESIPPLQKNDGSWARSDAEKSEAFAEHLAGVFKPFPGIAEEDQNVYNFLDAPLQLSAPIKPIKHHEVYEAFNNLNLKKSAGYDLISGKVLRELPKHAGKLITAIYNAIIRTGHFPSQWKVAQIILVPKPGKSPEKISSYRPISLLPILSKVFERLLMKRLNPIIAENNLIPDHQFGFRQQHATIEQVHRVVNAIHKSFEEKSYCSAAFLDVTQAFDKVWHEGLLYKIKQTLPDTFYRILKSYLTDRYYQVKQRSECTNLYPIFSGVPQGSVLGPILYIIFTADLPCIKNVTIATFADDTAIMATHKNPAEASRILQNSLTQVQHWLKTWHIKTNETKSIHVTFTLNKETCPPVILNDKEIPQDNCAKYLGIHLDRRLTWKKHIFTKRKQLGMKLRKLYWLMGKKSQLSTENKLLIYKAILMPVWTYGIQLWGSASESNIDILQRFQSKTLRSIVSAPWYVPNKIIHRDLNMCYVKDIIKIHSEKYHNRLEVHPNNEAVNLLDNSLTTRRLKRFIPLDLPFRFSI